MLARLFISLTVRCALAGLTLWLGASRSLRAQPSAYASSYYAVGQYRDPALNTYYTCGTTGPFSGTTGSARALCNYGLWRYDFLASSQAGMVKARSDVSILNLNGQSGQWFDFANATWADRLTFSGGMPSVLKLTVAWDGTLGASTDDGFNFVTSSGANAQWAFDASVPQGARLANYVNSAHASARTGQIVRGTIFDVQTFYLPVVGLSLVDFMFSAQTSAGVNTFMAIPGTAMTGYASADLSHTGKLTGLAFLDGSGQDVTSSVQYGFQNGTRVYSSATSTPEPATFALVAPCLLAVAYLRRRRRAPA